jgi:hypothetical protein
MKYPIRTKIAVNYIRLHLRGARIEEGVKDAPPLPVSTI